MTSQHNPLLLVNLDSLWLVGDEELVPAVRREHLQGTVPQDVRHLWISCIVSYSHLIQLMSACVCMRVGGDGRQCVYVGVREQGRKES